MNPKHPFAIGRCLARISIWTIVHHDDLVVQTRLYVWAASAALLFLSLAGLIPLQIALYLLLFCGLGILILLWTLINWRRSILLGLQDDGLKREAHTAMLALIHSRPDSIEKKKRILGRPLGKKSHS
jgi:hypothetical protein